MYTSMEHEAIDTHFLVPGDTYFLEQVLLVAESTNGRHKPTIAISTLAYITCSHTFNVEERLLKYILDKD